MAEAIQLLVEQENSFFFFSMGHVCDTSCIIHAENLDIIFVYAICNENISTSSVDSLKSSVLC